MNSHFLPTTFSSICRNEPVEGDLSESWPQEAVDRLLAIAPGKIGVGTVRNMNVPVVIEIAEFAPDENLSQWDQVNECDLEVQSGRVVIAGCTDYYPDARRIELPPGPYRARIYYGRLNARSADGLDGDDHYKIVLWSAASEPLKVIKQRAKVDAANSS